ncbi:MAG: hypothetical protein LBH98_06385 [Chitinispirillales bacterium]|jgi:homoserine trans-succinylase|nr:hypothetical protein [Chitinispirillales bacterium]
MSVRNLFTKFENLEAEITKRRYSTGIVSEIAVQGLDAKTCDYAESLKKVIENDVRQSKGVKNALNCLTNEEHLLKLAVVAKNALSEKAGAIAAKKKII